MDIEFSVAVNGRDRARVVRLAGELDMATAPRLLAALEQVVRSPSVTEVILDLECLRFIDAAGIGTLVRAHRLATSLGRHLRARKPRGVVDLVVRLTGVDDLLQVSDGRRGEKTVPEGFDVPGGQDL